MTAFTDMSIEPRCTGMWGALATSSPPGSNTAQEKSSRSLMFTDAAVFSSATPICSATFENRLLKISSITGSASVPTAAPGRGATRCSASSPPLAAVAAQPGSTTVVEWGSTMTAGPSRAAPGPRAARS